MEFFVNNNIDPLGGFTEAGISFETSVARFDAAQTIYAMSCGTPVPGNNDQELFETAWLLRFLGTKKLIVDHWYAGTIGSYTNGMLGKASDEVCEILGMDIPVHLRPFMMLEHGNRITDVRKEKILNYQTLLGDIPDISRIEFSYGPHAGFTIQHLLVGAREDESIINFTCPILSKEKGKEVMVYVRKSSQSVNGWVLTKSHIAQPIPGYSEKILQLLAESELAQLQRILGARINGKAAFRLYAQYLAANPRTAITLRDYSNARGTLKQCAENFKDQLIVAKRIYVNEPLSDSFISASTILIEPPFSRGDTVIACT